jgi:hypothetical protein
MIIQNGEGHDLFTADFHRSLEVNLPELVGFGTLEPLRRRHRSRRCDAPVAAQDRGKGPDRWCILNLKFQNRLNLPGAPIVAVAQLQRLFLDLTGGALRGMTRPAEI